MALPLLSYKPTSRNQRVAEFDIPGDETPRVFTAEFSDSVTQMDDIIRAAYRQIFNDQHFNARSRQSVLESQLRNGQITVREFIRGLATSDHFRRNNFDTNNNYRFAQMCVQRILGRDIYSDREKMAWSIVLATKGLNAFIDELVNSDEYLTTFGESIVPYQRRRVIPHRNKGDLPFERMARYDQNHLKQLKSLGNDFSSSRSVYVAGGGLPPEGVRQVGALLTYGLASVLGLTAVAVVLSWFGFLHI
jgi:phycobilisome rod-core linker protein